MTKTLLFRPAPCSRRTRDVHAIKNCLSAITAASQLIANELGGRERDRVERLRGEIRRLEEMLARETEVEPGADEPARDVDVEDLVYQVCTRLHDRADLRGVSLTVRVNAGPVHVQRKAFAEALFDLLHNAIEASSSGEVLIEVHQGDGGDVLFQIHDRGRGMSRETLARLGSMAPSDAAWSGLGVQLASAVVERHGGLIHFESQPGMGTTASIWLPSSSVEVAV